MEIKDHFLQSVLKCREDQELAIKMWYEIEKNYRSAGRHYHTIEHLNNMLAELVPFQELFSDWSIVVFALAYHDVIYNPLKNDNEEKSATLASALLENLEVPEHRISKCKQFILATKSHEASDHETNLFIDADLSILGTDSMTYTTYTKNVRREYSMYPDFLYKRGRKKVLNHFLNMERIFKTNEFAGKFEIQARRNLSLELRDLS